jgi:hypothetical protein
MNIQANNVFSFAGATGAAFPTLQETGFSAEFAPVYLSAPSHFGPVSFDRIPDAVGRAVVRTDTRQALGIVGTNYGIANNSDIRDVVVQACEKVLPREYLRDITLTEAVSGGGAFTKFTFEFPNAAATIRQTMRAAGYNRVKETMLNFRVSVINSFGGRTPVILQAGAMDLVCLNGMVLADFDTSKKRHTSGYSPEIFGAFLEEQAQQFKTRVSVWQAWAEKQITPAQAEATLKDAGISPRLTAKLMEQLDREAQARGQTVWALYSALTYYASHNSAEFGVKGSGQKDNAAEALYKRSAEVSRIVSSRAWAQLGGIAA